MFFLKLCLYDSLKTLKNTGFKELYRKTKKQKTKYIKHRNISTTMQCFRALERHGEINHQAPVYLYIFRYSRMLNVTVQL